MSGCLSRQGERPRRREREGRDRRRRHENEAAPDLKKSWDSGGISGARGQGRRALAAKTCKGSLRMYRVGLS